MIKSVYDNHRAETIDDYHNETSKLLTAFFFGDGHPFRKRMRLKVFDEEIAIRRVRLIPVKMEEPPHAAGQEPIIYIHQLLLEVIMKDPALEYDFADEGHNDLQTMYINDKFSEYINEQCFHVPTQNVDETERFLHYLAQHIPAIWDYFRIVEL
jgi:hypothetical protein